ncbi:MAG: hypothetical protein ABIA47_01540 [bacterium]
MLLLGIGLLTMGSFFGKIFWSWLQDNPTDDGYIFVPAIPMFVIMHGVGGMILAMYLGVLVGAAA